MVPLRVTADGEYMKVYMGERRVANVPNAVFPRTDRLYVDVEWTYPDRPILVRKELRRTRPMTRAALSSTASSRTIRGAGR